MYLEMVRGVINNLQKHERRKLKCC
uniref:Uncharacterized protein n=1 Tax=Arundo donax TaxID=35708 RepID=A0A0A8YGE8_ARUDO